MSKRGLPIALKMRHDAHYVDALANSAGAPIGRLVPIDRVDPNPDQPRQVMGDLSELIASISEKGIIEPLIVRQRGGRYQIVAGERPTHSRAIQRMTEGLVRFPDVSEFNWLEIRRARPQKLYGFVHRLDRTKERTGSLTNNLEHANQAESVSLGSNHHTGSFVSFGHRWFTRCESQDKLRGNSKFGDSS